VSKRLSAALAHMQPAAIPAWRALQAALDHTIPACDGDNRYTSELRDLTIQDRAEMRQICGKCPVQAACVDYATADQPAAGWWPTTTRTENAA